MRGQDIDLLKRCLKSVPAACTKLRRDIKAALAAGSKCVTPNGRIDCHGTYVKRKNGRLVCTFCGKSVTDLAALAGTEP
jgi:hypothetical protein